VSDLSENSIVTLRQDGGVQRVLYSPSGQATLTRPSSDRTAGGALSSDPMTGDLILSFPDGALAQRVSGRDGSLLHQYSLPARVLSNRCSVRSVDVGQREGLVYSSLMCYSGDDLIRVQYPDGRLHSEIHAGGLLVRVDEWGQRIYAATSGYPQTVRVLDMEGQLIHTITGPSTPFNNILNMVVTPGPDGGELIVLNGLNGDNHRLDGVHRDGSISFTQPCPDNVYDLAYADHGSVYLLVKETILVDGLSRLHPFIVQLDRQNNVVNRFVASSSWNGWSFSAITSTNDGLFAYDTDHNAVLVWKHHTQQEDSTVRVAETVSSAISAHDNEVSSKAVVQRLKGRQARHVRTMGGKLMRGA
jgi:hypothetical protein